MTAITPDAITAPATREVRVGTGAKVQALVYSLIGGQWAVGFWSALYVLVLQAHYFGKSLKHDWDTLNVLWHFHAVPLIGNWLFSEYNVGRHIFLRDSPEATLGYALVAMVVAPFIPGLVTKRKARPPFLDRVMIFLHMPSAYQDRPTSLLQWIFLVPSMIFASLPGWICSSVPVFLFIASMHKWDPAFHAGWLSPSAAWVYIVIGLVGGKFAGHKPAVKAGQDVQGVFLNGRLALYYVAAEILNKYANGVLHGFGTSGTLTRDQALDALTRQRSAQPGRIYPASYRLRWAELLRQHPDVTALSRARKVLTVIVTAVIVVAGGWGTYLRHYGIAHGFWLPW